MGTLNQARILLLIALVVVSRTVLAAAWIEPNVGQSADEYDYVIRASGLTALVAGQHVDFRLPSQHSPDTQPSSQATALDQLSNHNAVSHAVRLELVNARTDTTAVSGTKLGAVSHYFNGEKSSWKSGIAHLNHARINDVYTGIDVVYRLNKQRLEYDFEVAPGADASQIKLKLHGANTLSINADGEWVATTPAGTLRQLAPVVFQIIDGKRQSVAGAFELQNKEVMGFKLQEHDNTNALVIDPVIEFSGYVGGPNREGGFKLLENPTGNFVLLGTTVTAGLIGTTPADFKGDLEVFVMELNPATGNPNWVTILSGSGADFAENMAIDSQGNIVVVGYSESNDYPTLNAFQPNYVGTAVPEDSSFAFDGTVTKLSADGSSLIFSTYLGGLDADRITTGYFGFELLRGISIDSEDNIYVAGQTTAADFPVTTTIANRTCMETDVNATITFTSDIVFAKFSPTGERIMSACIGGTERDGGRQVAFGPDGSVFLAGFGRSPDLPGTTGGYQPLPIADLTYSPFVIKMNTDLTAIEFATYVGEGLLQEVVLDDSGNIYGSGTSFNGQFATTPGAFQSEFYIDPVTQSGTESFAFKLSADGTTLEYGTYLGGTKDDESTAAEVDALGRLYVNGVTQSADFPLKNPIFDNIGPLLGGTNPVLGNTMINNLRLGFAQLGLQGTAAYIAKNGVNQFAEIGTLNEIVSLNDIGTSDHDSSDILLASFNGNFLNGIIVTNKDAANEFYEWNQNTQAFDFLGTDGEDATDSRGVATLSPVSFAPPVVVANYGVSNQFVGIENTSPFETITIDFGRTDGNSTAIATGIVGPISFASNIVVANENQDVRLYPYDGGELVGAPLILDNNPGLVTALAIGDVDSDGDNDVVTASLDGPVKLILFSDGLPIETVVLGDTSAGDNTAVFLTDMDFDGDTDIFVGRSTSDMVFENTGGGTFTLQEGYSSTAQPTRALAVGNTNQSNNAIYVASDSGIDVTYGGRPSLTLSVLNATGTDLEFSTFLPANGASSQFRGLDFAEGSDSKILIAANTNGLGWPKVNSTANNLGNSDAIYMVLELDQDNDGALDGLDNCSLVSNPSQRDTNSDGFGNLCDPDLNNDGIVNFVDVSLFASLFLTSDEDADLNGDGNVAFLDFAILSNFFLLPPGPGLQ